MRLPAPPSRVPVLTQPSVLDLHDFLANLSEDLLPPLVCFHKVVTLGGEVGSLLLGAALLLIFPRQIPAVGTRVRRCISSVLLRAQPSPGAWDGACTLGTACGIPCAVCRLPLALRRSLFRCTRCWHRLGCSQGTGLGLTGAPWRQQRGLCLLCAAPVQHSHRLLLVSRHPALLPTQ